MSSRLSLNLSLKTSYDPKTIYNLVKDLSEMNSVSDKLSVLNDYLLKYEGELARIAASKLELPQCKLLLIEAIETLKKEIMNIKNLKEPETKNSMKRKYYENQQMILSDVHNRKGKNLMINLNSPAESDPEPWNPAHDHKKQKTIIDTTLVANLTQSSINRAPTMAADRSSALEIQSVTEPANLCSFNLRTDPVTPNYHSNPLTEQTMKNKGRSWTPQLHSAYKISRGS
ncbi:uncharacterized protein LOC18038129 [Citrus clementina]|uniref:uncharacterized protein LOC18038129 n=1 Tax=Citrus clementina TaxID=85681 RepID=UPI000CED56A9|nr:uncharacterized protein LOC18038129 [Citrus x clementina]